MGAARDLEISGRDASALQTVDLAAHDYRVDDHPVADDSHHCRVEDAGRDQMKGEFAALVLHGVTGIVAALIADHHVRPLGEQVDDFALAFVTPLSAHHYEDRHVSLPIDVVH